MTYQELLDDLREIENLIFCIKESMTGELQRNEPKYAGAGFSQEMGCLIAKCPTCGATVFDEYAKHDEKFTPNYCKACGQRLKF
jgi:DNA-directed RNA polymerase subunit RPC12/RpoP